MGVIDTSMDMPSSCNVCYKKSICFFAQCNGWIDNKRDDDCPLKSTDEISVLLDNANYDGFERGYLQGVTDCKVQIDEMIAEIEHIPTDAPVYDGKNVLYYSISCGGTQNTREVQRMHDDAVFTFMSILFFIGFALMIICQII